MILLLCYSCTAMYVGEYCQHLNPCHTGPGPRCQNGGTCNVRTSPTHGSPSFWCTCPIGYSASLCEIPIANSCDSDPCLNGGTCSLRSLDKYTCTCAPGYTGNIPTHVYSLTYATTVLSTTNRNQIRIYGHLKKKCLLKKIVWILTKMNAPLLQIIEITDYR